MNKIIYVCNDRSIKIEAEDLPGTRRIVISFSVNDKLAWEFAFRNALDQNHKISELLNQRAVAACKKIVSMSQREVEDYVEPDKMMISLYVWTHLKELRAKLGNVLWARR